MRFTAARPLLFLIASSLLVFAGARCSSSGNLANAPPASRAIGPTGGTLASSDGAIQLSIPAGALPKSVTLTVTPTSSPGAGALGTVYEIGPTGTTFASPITMTLHYAGVSLGAHAASDLHVATFASGAWQALAGASLDTKAQTVSGTTTHLSPYALWAASASSGAPSCASLEQAAACGSSSGAGSGSTSGSGGVVGCPSPPKCADTNASDLCAGYPGATMQSCTDSSTGYRASCCFAAGAPLCLAVNVGSGCGSSSGSSSGGATSGSGGTTCPPPATCANAATSACAMYPGSAMQGCTDTGAGLAGACCFASGHPVCIKTSGAVTCVGSSSGGTSSGSSGGAGSGSGATGSGGTTSCTTPTCATSTPCAAYPGATLSACTDSSSGYDATCCLPAGALPIVQGNVVSGSSSSGGSAGSGGGSSSGASTGSSSSGG